VVKLVRGAVQQRFTPAARADSVLALGDRDVAAASQTINHITQSQLGIREIAATVTSVTILAQHEEHGRQGL